MDLEEAKAWLRGERSCANFIRDNASSIAEAEACLMRADAGMTEQAYWIVRAHKEGLLEDD